MLRGIPKRIVSEECPRTKEELINVLRKAWDSQLFDTWLYENLRDEDAIFKTV